MEKKVFELELLNFLLAFDAVECKVLDAVVGQEFLTIVRANSLNATVARVYLGTQECNPLFASAGKKRRVLFSENIGPRLKILPRR